MNIGDLIPNNWSNTQIDKSDRGSKEKRFCINWHEVSKDHWEKFDEGIITKCSERKLEMHIQELLEKNYSSDMEEIFLQDAIDKIWMRILAIILNSCIDNLLHYWKLNEDTKDQNIDRKKKKYENRNYLYTAKLAYLWYICNHPGKLVAKDNELFRLNWIHKIKKYNEDYHDEELEEINTLPLEERPFFILTDDFLSDNWKKSFNNALKERKLLDEKLYLNRK